MSNIIISLDDKADEDVTLARAIINVRSSVTRRAYNLYDYELLELATTGDDHSIMELLTKELTFITNSEPPLFTVSPITLLYLRADMTQDENLSVLIAAIKTYLVHAPHLTIKSTTELMLLVIEYGRRMQEAIREINGS